MAGREPMLGEEAIIAEFMVPLAAGFPGAFGLTDDCAVVAPEPGHELVLKTDAIAEGVHFIGDESAADIGWKALAVNVSDLAAKGARPVAYLMSLSFPAAPDRAWLAGFTAGLAEAQAAFGIHLAGGDTDRRPGPLSITIAAIGSVPQGRMVRRGAARPGDLLFVSGTLGDAAVGLRLARGESGDGLAALDQPARAFLLQRFRRPAPRLALRAALLDHARAAMDLSDGLAKDLGRMARASGVSAEVLTDNVPLSDPVRRLVAGAAGWWPSIVAAGDDYEVLCAVEPARAEVFRAAAGAAGVPVAAIGRVGEGSGVRILGPDGLPLPLARTGWDHFG